MIGPSDRNHRPECSQVGHSGVVRDLDACRLSKTRSLLFETLPEILSLTLILILLSYSGSCPVRRTITLAHFIAERLWWQSFWTVTMSLRRLAFRRVRRKSLDNKNFWPTLMAKYILIHFYRRNSYKFCNMKTVISRPCRHHSDAKVCREYPLGTFYCRKKALNLIKRSILI